MRTRFFCNSEVLCSFCIFAKSCVLLECDKSYRVVASASIVAHYRCDAYRLYVKIVPSATGLDLWGADEAGQDARAGKKAPNAATTIG